jgi:hypothetical protein
VKVQTIKALTSAHVAVEDFAAELHWLLDFHKSAAFFGGYP